MDSSKFMKDIIECFDTNEIIYEKLKTILENIDSRNTILFSIAGDYLSLLERLQPPLNIVICGELNSGKSSLITELLDGEITVPSSEGPCTARFTRFVYSEKRSVREIRLKTETVNTVLRNFVQFQYYEEIPGEAKPFSNVKDISHLIKTQTEENIKKGQQLSTMIEIGLPCDLLKCNLRIIDCPGLGESGSFSQQELAYLPHLCPAVIVFMYDAKKGFNELEKRRFVELGVSLNLVYRELSEQVQFIIVGHKTDLNEEASRRDEEDISLEEIKHQIDDMVKKVSQEQTMRTAGTPINQNEVLSHLPLSSRERCRHRRGHQIVNLQLSDLYEGFLRSLVHHFDKLYRNVAKSVATDMWSSQFNDQQAYEYWFKLLEIASFHSSLINDIKTRGKKLITFEENFELHGLEESDDRVTYVGIYAKNHPDIRQMPYSYEACEFLLFKEDNIIYVVWRRMPKLRLLDCLHDLSLETIQFLIHQCFTYNTQKFAIGGVGLYRPDMIFITADYEVKFLPIIWMDKELPIFMKNVSLLPDPFNLPPICETPNDRSSWLLQSVCCFGWIIWLLLEGSGEVAPDMSSDTSRLMDQLKRGRFSTYPKLYDDIMIACWSTDSDSVNQTIWFITMVMGGFINSNNWITVQANTLQSRFLFKLKEKTFFDENPHLRNIPQIVKREDIDKIDLKVTKQTIVKTIVNKSILAADFGDCYKLYSGSCNSMDFIVIRLSQEDCKKLNYSEEKFKIYNFYLTGSNPTESLFYENTNKSILYVVITLPCSSQRLLDIISDLDWYSVEHIIIQASRLKVTRPDTIFLFKDGKNFIDISLIPKHPELHLVLKDNKPQIPFYLHPEQKSDQNIFYDQSFGLYNTGWFLWTLIEGSGSKVPDLSAQQDSWITELSGGKFPNCPIFYKDMVLLLWNLKNVNLSIAIETEQTVKELSKQLDSQLCNSLVNVPSNRMLHFDEFYQLFSIRNQSQMLIVTQITRKSNHENDLIRFYNAKRQLVLSGGNYQNNESKHMLYQTVQGEAVFAIDIYDSGRVVRLVDCCDCMDFPEIDNIIKLILSELTKAHQFSPLNSKPLPPFLPQFKLDVIQILRPDNIFLLENGHVIIRQSLPNDPDLPLRLKNGLRAKPFHLSKPPSQYHRVQLLHSFGWLIWILLEGSGSCTPEESATIEEHIDRLHSSRLAPIPQNYIELLRICWNTKENTFLDDFRNIAIALSSERKVWFDNLPLIKEQEFEDNLCFGHGYWISKNQGGYHVILRKGGNFNEEIQKIFTNKFDNIYLLHSNSNTGDNHRQFGLIFQKDLIWRTVSGDAVYLEPQINVNSVRLLDHVDKLNFQQVEEIIGLTVLQTNMLGNSFYFRNFRADTVFILKEVVLGFETEHLKKIAFSLINRSLIMQIVYSIPNHSDMPFYLKGRHQVLPFHIHPDSKDYKDNVLKHRVETLYSFGWFLWILLEGSGKCTPQMNGDGIDNWLQQLKQGKFPNYPPCYTNILKLCWTVNSKNWNYVWQNIKMQLPRHVIVNF